MGSVCVLGSLNADVVVFVERFHDPGETVRGVKCETFLGGKGGNQAVAASRLGLSASMVGCLGEDSYARLYLDALAAEGVDASRAFSDPSASTGLALIEVDSEGENRIIVVPGANASLSVEMVERARSVIEARDCLLLQLEVPYESVLRAASIARGRGRLVILDPAPAPDRAIPEALLPLCDYVTPNESELRALTGMPVDSEPEAVAACRALLGMGARAVVHKRGDRGALLVNSRGVTSAPSYRVEAVDTTAAGDTFNAAFAAALLGGGGESEAVAYANAAAALSVTGAGAQGAMPSAEAVDRFIELHK